MKIVLSILDPSSVTVDKLNEDIDHVMDSAPGDDELGPLLASLKSLERGGQLIAMAKELAVSRDKESKNDDLLNALEDVIPRTKVEEVEDASAWKEQLKARLS
eukprot:7619929-Pyramimonas_sp.AAC.2